MLSCIGCNKKDTRGSLLIHQELCEEAQKMLRFICILKQKISNQNDSLQKEVINLKSENNSFQKEVIDLKNENEKLIERISILENSFSLFTQKVENQNQLIEKNKKKLFSGILERKPDRNWSQGGFALNITAKEKIVIKIAVLSRTIGNHPVQVYYRDGALQSQLGSKSEWKDIGEKQFNFQDLISPVIVHFDPFLLKRIKPNLLLLSSILIPSR